MKRIIKLLGLVLILSLTGCFKNQSMEDITIYTTSYPIEYVTNRLYKEHSTIKSIYPNGVDINKYKITDTLIKKYDDNDMYIFDGLTKERNYVKPMRNQNKNLKIIDVTNDITYQHANEDLWLDPSSLLSIANNIRKGFNEYLDATYLIDEINNNYNELKIDLTSLESKYREELANTKYDTIVISDDMFLFLENYGLNVISLDKDNENYDKNIIEVKKLIYTGYLKYIFIPDTDTNNNNLNNYSVEKLKLNTLSNLTDEQRENYDYISLMNENLETLKKQLNYEE